MIYKVLRKFCIIIIIILCSILLYYVYNIALLRINVLDINKRSVLSSEGENNILYKSHINNFFKYISKKEFDKAYSIMDNSNAKYKFSNITTFVTKMKNICFIDEVYNENNSYCLQNTITKEKYIDSTYKCYFYTQKEMKTIDLILREYKNNTYKIFITNYFEGDTE